MLILPRQKRVVHERARCFEHTKHKQVNFSASLILFQTVPTSKGKKYRLDVSVLGGRTAQQHSPGWVVSWFRFTWAGASTSVMSAGGEWNENGRNFRFSVQKGEKGGTTCKCISIPTPRLRFEGSLRRNRFLPGCFHKNPSDNPCWDCSALHLCWAMKFCVCGGTHVFPPEWHEWAHTLFEGNCVAETQASESTEITLQRQLI